MWDPRRRKRRSRRARASRERRREVANATNVDRERPIEAQSFVLIRVHAHLRAHMRRVDRIRDEPVLRARALALGVSPSPRPSRTPASLLSSTRARRPLARAERRYHDAIHHFAPSPRPPSSSSSRARPTPSMVPILPAFADALARAVAHDAPSSRTRDAERAAETASRRRSAKVRARFLRRTARAEPRIIPRALATPRDRRSTGTRRMRRAGLTMTRASPRASVRTTRVMVFVIVARASVERSTRARADDGDRKILQRTKSLLRFLGLGHMRNMGADLPYRKRVEYMLTTIFGKTFEKTSHWYGKPNPDAFFATVMKMAGAKKVKLADGSEIFRMRPGTTSYEVNRGKLRSLGVEEDKLRRLFAKTPAADANHQVKPVEPLEVPPPGKDLEEQEEHYEEDKEDDEEPGAVDDEEAAALMMGLSTSKVSNTEDSRRTPKKRASGNRQPKKALVKAVKSDIGVSTTSDTPIKLSVNENPSKKVKIERKEEPKGKGKGKEPIGDSDDEGDDAVPVQAVEDDDDHHTKMMAVGRKVRLGPRDRSHVPLPLGDYDMTGIGVEALEDEKTASQAEWASKGYECWLQPNDDPAGPCGEHEVCLDHCFDEFLNFPTPNLILFDREEKFRQSQLMGWERNLDHLQVDLDGMDNFGRDKEAKHITETIQDLKNLLRKFCKGRDFSLM